MSGISTTSSNLWREGEKILKGEIDLSESMQLCLDGSEPNDENEGVEEDTPLSIPIVESIPNVIGTKGIKGIEKYLNRDTKLLRANTSSAKSSNKQNLISVDSKHILSPTSYADTVSALLNSPQPQLLSKNNKENDTMVCNDKNVPKIENGTKLPRKRSLTEMIGHNPLCKERKPLGQKRCFETDL